MENYGLYKGNRFSFSEKEIQNDPILKIAATTLGCSDGVLEVEACDEEEALKKFGLHSQEGFYKVDSKGRRRYTIAPERLW